MSDSALFFFSVFRPPPTSTLFPYTTLFRSDIYPLYYGEGLSAGTAPYAAHPGSHPVEYPVLDRKSTRLNSSHVRISYAVFCLKKKKNTRGPAAARAIGDAPNSNARASRSVR